jgi:hypothetical protein
MHGLSVSMLFFLLLFLVHQPIPVNQSFRMMLPHLTVYTVCLFPSTKLYFFLSPEVSEFVLVGSVSEIADSTLHQVDAGCNCDDFCPTVSPGANNTCPSGGSYLSSSWFGNGNGYCAPGACNCIRNGNSNRWS